MKGIEGTDHLEGQSLYDSIIWKRIYKKQCFTVWIGSNWLSKNLVYVAKHYDKSTRRHNPDYGRNTLVEFTWTHWEKLVILAVTLPTLKRTCEISSSALQLHQHALSNHSCYMASLSKPDYSYSVGINVIMTYFQEPSVLIKPHHLWLTFTRTWHWPAIKSPSASL